jgi:hypothetical protein
MKNPYNNNYNKFDFTIEELKFIDESWKLIESFNTSYLTKMELREKTIKLVNKNYSIIEFDKLEIIIEKMFWNMIFLLNKILENNFIEQNIKQKDSSYGINKQIKKVYLKNKILSESYVNKIIINKDNLIYYKYIYPNNFDIIISSIMTDRIIYETVYNNIDKLDINFIQTIISNINIKENFDYLFPNINTMIPFCYNNRIERIKKYYFNNDSDSYWFNYFS